jgi:hypothetical protein
MNEARIDDLLDGLVAPFELRPDGWEDVLARTHRTQRRHALVGAALFALLLVPASLALRDRITDLFQGTPAPPAVSTSFEANNRMADMATRKGFGEKFPHADVSKAHGVLEVQTSDGPEDLWAAPDDQGGQCWWVDFANDPDGPGGKYGFGGCDTTGSASKIDPGVVWVAPHATLLTLWGRVYVPADAVVVRLQDGSSLTLPVVEGGFLASLDYGDRLERVTAYEGDEEVASWEAPVG